MHRLTLGDFELTSLSDGGYWLDGGAMFGVVPKPLWEKKFKADELNRLRLGLNSLLVRTGDHTVSGGIGWGLGIWMVVLSIIACYFGGKTAGKLSGTTDSNRGMYQGLVMFGMAIFTTILVMALSLGSTVRNGAANPANYGAATVADVVAKGGIWLFIALLLSMVAAAIGGSHGARNKRIEALPERRDNIRQVA